MVIPDKSEWMRSLADAVPALLDRLAQRPGRGGALFARTSPNGGNEFGQQAI